MELIVQMPPLTVPSKTATRQAGDSPGDRQKQDGRKEQQLVFPSEGRRGRTCVRQSGVAHHEGASQSGAPLG